MQQRSPPAQQEANQFSKHANEGHDFSGHAAPV